MPAHSRHSVNSSDYYYPISLLYYRGTKGSKPYGL